MSFPVSDEDAIRIYGVPKNLLVEVRIQFINYACPPQPALVPAIVQTMFGHSGCDTRCSRQIGCC